MLKSKSNESVIKDNASGKDLFSSTHVKVTENETKTNEINTKSGESNIPEIDFLNTNNSTTNKQITNVNSVKSLIFIYEDNTFEVIKRR